MSSEFITDFENYIREQMKAGASPDQIISLVTMLAQLRG